MITLPYLRAHHIATVVKFLAILFILEGLYIFFRSGEPVWSDISTGKENECKPVECPTSNLPYEIRYMETEMSKKFVLCLNGDEVVLNGLHNSIHLVLINSLNISSHSVETFLFHKPSIHQMMKLMVIPENKYFIVACGEFTNKTLLASILKMKFMVTIDQDTISDVILFSGYLLSYNSSYIDQLILRDNTEMRGCVKPDQGLVTCEMLTAKCDRDEVSYYVSAGVHRIETHASICFNETFYVNVNLKSSRGLNVVLINDETLQVEDIKTFDTSRNGNQFDAYLRSITGHKILVIASEDDASRNLKNSSRIILEETFGSSVVGKMAYMDNFVFVGQRGLYMGSASEKLRKSYTARPVEITGCLGTRGVGILRKLPDNHSNVGVTSTKNNNHILRISITNNTCMMWGTCPADHFPVAIDTGFKNEKKPTACVGGSFIPQEELGRGLNVIIYNTIEKKVSRVKNFDTYEDANVEISKFLSEVDDDDLVIVFTHDDALRRLTLNSKNALSRIGSYYINMLHIRDSWLLIGQKDMVDFSPYEKVNFAQYMSYNWSEPIRFIDCVPFKIIGRHKPGVMVENTDRLEYCRRLEDKHSMESFCAELNRWQPFQTFIVQNPVIKHSPLFYVPIIVYACSVEMVVQSQLERISNMAGVNSGKVLVFYNPEEHDYASLIDLFGFVKIPHKDSDMNITSQLSVLFEQYPAEVIIFEKGVLPTKYYLEYLAHLYEVYANDDTICSVSTYNHHAFVGSTTTSDLFAFRSTSIPRLSYLVKTSCMTGHDALNLPMETIMPEISYSVMHPLTPGHKGISPVVRSYAQGSILKLFDANGLFSVIYNRNLVHLISSTFVEKHMAPKFAECLVDVSFGKNLVIIFEQDDPNDIDSLKEFTKCFRISTFIDNHAVHGFYRGVFRFTHKSGIYIYLIGSRSEFATVP